MRVFGNKDLKLRSKKTLIDSIMTLKMWIPQFIQIIKFRIICFSTVERGHF